MTVPDIESRGYMREAFEDLEPVRVIIWPRRTGKTSFLAYEAGVFTQLPGTHIVIIHPNEHESRAFERHLVDIEPASYTSISYAKLVQTFSDLVQDLKSKRILLYFSEPDAYNPQGEITEGEDEPSTICGGFVATLLMEQCAIQQITYIGTACARGERSRLSKVASITGYVHSLHPREAFGREWLSQLRGMRGWMSEEMLRTQVLGHY
jgi:hypothetical protein